MAKSDATRWTVLGQGTHPQKFLCRCECGVEREVWKIHFTYRKSRSCGCAMIEAAKKRFTKHGMTGTPEYAAWISMRDRCYSGKNSFYYNYGGRGIKVCDRWNNPEDGFANFIADMGKRPSSRHSLDRYPNQDGDYEPTNCRWATKVEQARNTRTCKPIEHNGEWKTVGEWAEIYNIPRGILDTRLKAGWSWERATTEPIHRNILSPDQVREIKRDYKENSPKWGAYAMAVKYGVSPNTIKRLVSGLIQRYEWATTQPVVDPPPPPVTPAPQ